MPGIFVSYRRDDSAGYAGRLGDALKERFGSNLVFMDIDNIEPGLDFVEAIENAVQSCDVLLAVIGKQWLTAIDAKGQRRIDALSDYVRLEISAALIRKIRVIPILVQGSSMPSIEDLPENLAPLTRRNAIEVADNRWSYDMSQLIETIDKIIKPTSWRVPTNPPIVSAPPSKKRKSFFLLQWVFVLLLVIAVIWFFYLIYFPPTYNVNPKIRERVYNAHKELKEIVLVAGVVILVVNVVILWLRTRK